MHIHPLHKCLLYCFKIMEFSFHRNRDAMLNNFSHNLAQTIVYWPPCSMIVYVCPIECLYFSNYHVLCVVSVVKMCS